MRQQTHWMNTRNSCISVPLAAEQADLQVAAIAVGVTAPGFVLSGALVFATGAVISAVAPDITQQSTENPINNE